MKIKKLLLFLLMACAFLCMQCKKEKMNDCIEIPSHEFTDVWGFPLFETVYPAFGMPYFNPNNPDEFIFRDYTNQTPDSFNLVKYNINTKEYSIILKEYFGYRPRWSKKDWTIFSIWSRQVGFGVDI